MFLGGLTEAEPQGPLLFKPVILHFFRGGAREIFFTYHRLWGVEVSHHVQHDTPPLKRGQRAPTGTIRRNSSHPQTVRDIDPVQGQARLGSRAVLGP